MSKFERKHVSSYIITNFPELEDGSVYAKEVGDNFYCFTVIEPGTYNFHQKIKISPENESIINEMRAFYNDR